MNIDNDYDARSKSVQLIEVNPDDVTFIFLGDDGATEYTVEEVMETIDDPMGGYLQITYDNQTLGSALYRGRSYDLEDVYFTFPVDDGLFSYTITSEEFITEIDFPGMDFRQLDSVSILAEVEEY